nr:reverse transcriptase domain-containing protein [Tanacetum cinerariifolium]
MEKLVLSLVFAAKRLRRYFQAHPIAIITDRPIKQVISRPDAVGRLNLDLLEERRKLAAMSEARSKSKMMKYYNSRVRGVAFKPGDFVYRSNDASHAVAGGKLGPKWEGPYEETDALGNGAYKLRTTGGTINVTKIKHHQSQSAWPHLPAKGQDPVGPL